MQNINEIKDQICDVCHKMWQLGWVAANDGNVSVRLEDGRILATGEADNPRPALRGRQVLVLDVLDDLSPPFGNGAG